MGAFTRGWVPWVGTIGEYHGRIHLWVGTMGEYHGCIHSWVSTMGEYLCWPLRNVSAHDQR